MKVALLTNEYPPYIYGGAGVHVDYLSRALAKIMEVEVRAFGDQDNGENPKVKGYPGWDLLKKSALPFAKVLETVSIDLAFNHEPIDAQVVHCHTWYTFFAGFLAKYLYGTPLVVTMHSLEPLRPWKEEQLKSGYRLSSWIEKNGVNEADKVIAVSAEMKEDIIKYYGLAPEKVEIIHNGIDLSEYQPTQNRSYLDAEGIHDPYLLFVGRISRQKGIIHLVDAFLSLPESSLELVLCASSPDTPEIEAELRAKVAGHPRIKWINKMVSKPDVIQLYSHAQAFVCPSIYEPFGIINLEAMACKTPVIASGVGGIKEVVIPDETGILVEPGRPDNLAAAIAGLLGNPERMMSFKEKGRRRVEEHFSWDKIAQKTKDLYERMVINCK